MVIRCKGRLQCACVNRVFAQLFFNTKELVVFRDTVGATHGTCLDLPSIRRNCDIGDGHVFGFTGTVRDDRVVAVCLTELDCFECFSERADLVDLNQNRVGYAEIDALLQELNVGDE